jgi:hypothetical protein
MNDLTCAGSISRRRLRQDITLSGWLTEMHISAPGIGGDGLETDRHGLVQSSFSMVRRSSRRFRSRRIAVATGVFQRNFFDHWASWGSTAVSGPMPRTFGTGWPYE